MSVMPREDGHANLIAAHPANRNAVKHGLYSGRVLADRAREIRSALMTLEHVQPLDVLAAEEIGSIIAALEAIDRDLMTRPNGISKARLLEHKARLSRQLRDWLREFGGTPRARADWAARLSRPTVGEEIARRLAQLQEERNGHE
jgi:hypothetical protein